MIRLSELLKEAPLTTYQTIGDFDKPASFKDPRDISSIKNPVTVEKLKNIFKNVDANFDFYFVNKPGLRRFAEKGKATEDFIYAPYPEGLGLDRETVLVNKDHITVFFVGNSAADKIPMTSWTIAHRFGHVLNRTYQFQEYTKWLDKQFDELLGMYNVNKPNESGRFMSGYENQYYKNSRKFDLAKGRLFNTIGTMRSAREGRVHLRYYEFYYELFVQYLKDGDVKFNPLPKNILVGFGPYGSKTIASTRNLPEAQEQLDMIANTIPYYVNDVINSSVGDIFVM